MPDDTPDRLDPPELCGGADREADDHGDRDHTCRLAWLMDDIGRFLAGEDADDAEVGRRGRQAIRQGTHQVDELLQSAFAAHEVVATELRMVGRRHGSRRTVFAVEPTPVAILLLCLRLCDVGDEVSIVHHTAGHGSTTRTATWPFGMDQAEQLTRPPRQKDWDTSIF